MSGACTTTGVFQELGDNISSPNGIAIDAAANRLYLVNSNSNVLYNWEEGSLQVYDITNPLAPVLIDTLQTESFSGEAYQDVARKLLYVSNRFSLQSTVTEDQMFVINIDETSPDFLNLTEVTVGANPYGLYCCYPADRMWISENSNSFQYLDLATLTVGGTSLQKPLSSGGTISNAYTSFVTVMGNQAFLPVLSGGLLVINLDEVDDTTKNPVDYWVQDFWAPADISNDGTYLYLGDQEQDEDAQWLLFVLDPTKVPPLTDNTDVQVVDKEDIGFVVAQIEVSQQPQRVFITSQYAFVTCKNGDDNGLLSVVSLASRSVVTTLTLQQEPFGMALYAPGGVEQYLYIGNVESNTLSIVDIPTLTVVATYP